MCSKVLVPAALYTEFVAEAGKWRVAGEYLKVPDYLGDFRSPWPEVGDYLGVW